MEQGSHIPQGNEIQTVLFKRKELSERNKKRSWEAPLFSQIQVVLVLGWRQR